MNYSTMNSKSIVLCQAKVNQLHPLVYSIIYNNKPCTARIKFHSSHWMQ
jgi:hypothetical protein